MSANNGKIPRAEALEVVQECIEGHTFSPATAERDVNFAHNTLWWLFDQFVMYPDDEHIHSNLWDGYPSTELPTSIQSLFVTDTFSFGKRWVSSASSKIHRVADFEEIRATLPMLQTLKDGGMNYPAIIEHFTNHPGDLVGACLAKRYDMTKYGVSIKPGSTYEKSWGIRLVSNSRSIRTLPFGEDGKTDKPVDWMLTYHERPHILAEVMAYAGFLTVKDSTHCQEKIDELQLANLSEKLEEPVPEVGMLCRYGYGESLEGAILRVLVKNGVVTVNDLMLE